MVQSSASGYYYGWRNAGSEVIINSRTTELVMYSRTTGCPYVSTAKLVLQKHQIPYREIFIDQDPDARARVLNWTGFLSVPTLILAAPGEDLPLETPPPLPQGTSPRGIDRGMMITEPNSVEFVTWLEKHGLIG